ncbi:MAG: tRNA pseudouridine32 synthase/23S rRNA pseudouridine746 synthase [Methyloprofundus sp.]|nr:MAG: tRNA pseudouridine32 synthase/23S rRNA pseudouridine746 synthase [Methyloprofundus sp.]
MSLHENYFISFKESIDSYSLPERFTFPFYYQPHPLCLLAVNELQSHLTTQQEWQHDFGITANKTTAIGKMFGVLLVRNKANEIGCLAAFSGKIAGTNQLSKFVPPVFDMLATDGFFMAGQQALNDISAQIKILAENPKIPESEAFLSAEIAVSSLKIKEHRAKMVAGRKSRKLRRTEAVDELSANEFLQLQEQLAKESIQHKNQLRDLNIYWGDRVEKAEQNLVQLTAELRALKNQRKQLSADLQQQLFDQYHFLNIKGVSKSLCGIFKETAQLTPPAAAGECAAPKLLQYAFLHELQPLAMAEFWWGASPKSEIRKHQHFYGACQGKCQPILAHMLDGMAVDANPLLNNPAAGKTINIIYQDDVMLVINKPAEFLSVPGKNIEDSVYLRIKQSYPGATGSLIVHRLDMSTSGLMLIALTKEAHKNLQKQFIKRTVVKRYVALLDGLLKEDAGIIDLPLRVDLDDRPRQLVCYEHGRAAITRWEVMQRKGKQTKVYFYPETGRTHQLRVHAAHVKGLNMSIVGDDLYGSRAKRLHLHAEYLQFSHPSTQELMSFQVDAEF